MYVRKPRLRPLVPVLIVLVSLLIGTAVGKYISSTTFTGKVTFSAELASAITLLESKAEKNEKGEYILQESTTVTENSYDVVIPGLDIPKDPYITITGKTPIGAYLFIEVLDGIPGSSNITYDLRNCWLDLNMTGKNGGAVFVYSDGSVPMKITDETSGLDKIKIIEDDIITVSQKLELDEKVSMTFYACMGEAASSSKTDAAQQAKEVYQTINA